MTTTTDPGYRLEYVVNHEAWWGPAVAATVGDRDPSINVFKSNRYGGAPWEFTIVDRSRAHNRPMIQLRMHDEAFGAFIELAPFFAALAAEQPNTLNQVRAILDRLGFTDVTQRVDPDPDRFARLQHTSPEGN